MRGTRITAKKGPWIELVEAIHNPARDDASWLAPILDSAKALLPNAQEVAIYIADYEPDLSSIRNRAALPEGLAANILEHAGRVTSAAGRAAVEATHFWRPVGTIRERMRSAKPELRPALQSTNTWPGIADGLGVIAHPVPGIVATLIAVYRKPIVLAPYERGLLTRIALHLENGYRARLKPESVRAVLGANGRILHREADAPNVEKLASEASRIDTARTRKHRTSEESLDLWKALTEGKVSIVPRYVDGRTCYVVLDNPVPARAARALTPIEAAVLSLAARGVSTKLTSYALGIASSSISQYMAKAAAKVGAMSRSDLVRLAALVANDPRAELATSALTAAERDVLDLLQKGLSNDRIAIARSRSVRTIANQVASILRKTKMPSRRALIAART